MKTHQPIYLDYNASTPCLPSVIETMHSASKNLFGNPSSSHHHGRLSKLAIEDARSKVALLINAEPSEIYFTGCATEANNIALLGITQQTFLKEKHIIVSSIEHPAVLQPALYLQKLGWDLTLLPVGNTGLVDPSDLSSAMRKYTALVSIMHANNETGSIQPIEELAPIVHDSNALFHIDAAQSTGKIPVNVRSMGVDLLTIAGHKFYAPKGIGALYIRNGIEWNSITKGANHELGIRPGTENITHIVGLGKAAEESIEISEICRTLIELRDFFHDGLLEQIPELILNGDPVHRLPNTLNVSFPGVKNRDLLSATANDISASLGSACHSDDEKVSGVLAAMGIGYEQAHSAIRFSVGRFTTRSDIEQAISALLMHYNSLRDL